MNYPISILNKCQVLKRAFDSFDQEKKGAISTEIVGTVLKMMGQTVNRQILAQIIEEVDVDDYVSVYTDITDITVFIINSLVIQYLPKSKLLFIHTLFTTGSGELEFNEFVMLATKFMNEEDEEEMKKELKEAFRLYDRNSTFPSSLFTDSFVIYLLNF
ncbi:Troponin C, isoform 2 [Armadillidium vulgare]|nr:Troponin C, isoform 2 [Armadillidium vulgare]